MNILMICWKSFGNLDIKEAFVEEGHIVFEMPFDNDITIDEPALIREMKKKIIDNNIDFVFSFNYFPWASLACKDEDICYISWVYDSPYVRLYNYSVIFPTNRVFVFDKAQYIEFRDGGISTVNYLPMAANTRRLDKMNDFSFFKKTGWNNQKSVSFVGSLYTEKHRFYERLKDIKASTRGYLEGLMDVQKQIYGMNIVQQMLPQDIIDDMLMSLPMRTREEGVESIEYLLGQYVINREITAIERQEYLHDVADRFGLDLYTADKNYQLNGCINHGPIDYYDFAPYVFKKSKINLNISLRSITSGIPLRAFDIMGAGGFLLTNYQEDFTEFFVNEEDYVYFDSKQDMMKKIEYYLTHDEERQEIAVNGHRKISANHTYRHRVKEMISSIK